jgi:hypothetical protein
MLFKAGFNPDQGKVYRVNVKRLSKSRPTFQSVSDMIAPVLVFCLFLSLVSQSNAAECTVASGRQINPLNFVNISCVSVLDAVFVDLISSSVQYGGAVHVDQSPGTVNIQDTTFVRCQLKWKCLGRSV